MGGRALNILIEYFLVAILDSEREYIREEGGGVSCPLSPRIHPSFLSFTPNSSPLISHEFKVAATYTEQNYRIQRPPWRLYYLQCILENIQSLLLSFAVRGIARLTG